MLSTTFVQFWQLSVPSTCNVYLTVCVWMCCTSVLLMLLLTSATRCLMMLSYCSHFIIVYNYIFVIMLYFSHFMFIYFVSLFITGRRRRRRILFSSTSISHKTHIHKYKHKQTQICIIQYNIGSGKSSNTVLNTHILYMYYIKLICGF